MVQEADSGGWRKYSSLSGTWSKSSPEWFPKRENSPAAGPRIKGERERSNAGAVRSPGSEEFDVVGGLGRLDGGAGSIACTLPRSICFARPEAGQYRIRRAFVPPMLSARQGMPSSRRKPRANSPLLWPISDRPAIIRAPPKILASRRSLRAPALSRALMRSSMDCAP